MGDAGGNSLINVGNFSKPVTTLIEKISNAVGVLYEPRRIRNKAKANADAALIEANSKIEITELQHRGMERWVIEQGQKQENMEKIIEGSIPLIEDDSKPEAVDNDWLANFFDKCRLISDDEMQKLWSKLLSGEANNPGNYSKRTINLLSGLDKSDAVLFTKICNYTINIIGRQSLFIDNIESEPYKNNGIKFIDLQNLENIGLINFNYMSGFQIDIDSGSQDAINKKIVLKYYENKFNLYKPIKGKESIDIGKVIFTKIGRELSQICIGKPVKGFENYLIEKFIASGWIRFEPITFELR